MKKDEDRKWIKLKTFEKWEEWIVRREEEKKNKIKEDRIEREVE